MAGILALLVWFGWTSFHEKHDLAAALSLVLLPLVLLGSFELAWQALRPGPMLAMDAWGIDHAAVGPIPWSEIVGLAQQETSTRGARASNLVLGVRAPLRFMATASPLRRFVTRHWRTQPPLYETVPIALNQLNKAPDLVVAVATAFRERVEPPRLKEWNPGMTAEEVATFARMHQLIADVEASTSDASSAEQRHAARERNAAFQPDAHSALLAARQRDARVARTMAIAIVVGLIVLVARIVLSLR